MILLSEIFENLLNEKCWDGYRKDGMKKKNGKMVPDCVPIGGARKVDKKLWKKASKSKKKKK